jgi:DNA-binding NarL/FixJ family response regulator
MTAQSLIKPASLDVRAQVAIADKSPVVRSGLSDFIGRDGRFEVVDAVPTGGAFISLCSERTIDIGIMGWALPDMTRGDILDALKRRQLSTRAVIYTGDSSRDVLRQAVKGGAWGFVSKSEEPQVLLDTISTVYRGRLSMPYIDFEALTHDPLDALTARERELLAALANGWSNSQIATRFGISRNTVKYHLKNLYDKLGVNNRAMAVALFLSTPRAE